MNTYKFPLYIFYRKLGVYPVVTLLIGNLKMILDLNSNINSTLFFKRIAFHNITNFVLKNLDENSVFFDIGTHSGYFSIISTTVIKSGQIHAFEPVPHIYKNFLKSIKLNNINNIKLNKLCVSNFNGYTTFSMSKVPDVSSIKLSNANSYTFQKKIRCKTTRLDTYCKINKIKKIDLIKIDAEGSEKNVFFSSKRLLKKFMPKLIVEFVNTTAEPFNYHPNEVYDFLIDLGYKIYSNKDSKLTIQEKKNTYHEDLFCIPV